MLLRRSSKWKFYIFLFTLHGIPSLTHKYIPKINSQILVILSYRFRNDWPETKTNTILGEQLKKSRESINGIMSVIKSHSTSDFTLVCTHLLTAGLQVEGWNFFHCIQRRCLPFLKIKEQPSSNTARSRPRKTSLHVLNNVIYNALYWSRRSKLKSSTVMNVWPYGRGPAVDPPLCFVLVVQYHWNKASF